MNERSFWRLTKGIHIHITLGVILKKTTYFNGKKIIWLMRFGVLNLNPQIKVNGASDILL